MEKLSLSVEDEHVAQMDALVEDDEADSRSEAVRVLLDRVEDLEERVDELETELKHARARADEMEKQAQEARKQSEDVEELATFADVERRRARRRERLEEARRQAGLVERAKWQLFGEPADLEERAADVFQEDELGE